MARPLLSRRPSGVLPPRRRADKHSSRSACLCSWPCFCVKRWQERWSHVTCTATSSLKLVKALCRDRAHRSVRFCMCREGTDCLGKVSSLVSLSANPGVPLKHLPNVMIFCAQTLLLLHDSPKQPQYLHPFGQLQRPGAQLLQRVVGSTWAVSQHILLMLHWHAFRHLWLNTAGFGDIA